MASFFAEIQNFNKNKLQKTETVVRTNCYIKESETEKHGLRQGDDFTEYYDSPEEFRDKINKIINYIKQTSKLVIYTGAGISTSAKLSDYRGTNGSWTLSDNGLGRIATIALEDVKPTISHLIIKKLVDEKICSMVVSTNVDGLHRKSGLTENQLAELHGNCYREHCINCKKEFLRDFDCTSSGCDFVNHFTPRHCDECNTQLRDTIIHFREPLPKKELRKAVVASEGAEVSLVLGTSMRVSPACQLPSLNPNSILIICNRQTTPYDSDANVVIRADIDDVMQEIMNGLNINIPLGDENMKIIRPPINHAQNFLNFINKSNSSA